MSFTPMASLARLTEEQASRNRRLLDVSPELRRSVRSEVLPLVLDPCRGDMTPEEDCALGALEKRAATIAIQSLVSLAKANDIDHLGGALELIPPLLMTLATIDYDRRHYTIEHGHTSAGYYAALAALGFLDEHRVIDGFRRGLSIAGHVSWVPGGTELSSGRLGVMMPVATGLALGVRANKGSDALVIVHCGDAGWVSGQALGGFVAATLHHAPVVFVMHRNGIQLSGTTAHIMNKDPRPVLASLGITLIEIPSLEDRRRLFGAYREAFTLARNGQPALIYPVGFRSSGRGQVTVRTLGEMYGIAQETEEFAGKHHVSLDTEIWIPGSLMSYRDAEAMLQCVFYVNDLPGGEGHHDGGMKGRDPQRVLSNPMLHMTDDERSALERLKRQPARVVVTTARPAPGTPNLTVPKTELERVALPGTDKWITARAGSEAAYVEVAKRYPDRCFIVSADLNPSTKLAKAAALVPPGHTFEMSIQEQAATLLTDGLAFSSREPQMNVFSTFGAFIEGIAREGFEMWRYQRNLDGLNEGLNLIMHLAHVGTCTGRDHFSGWSLDWVNFALGYLPYLRRFYAPSDARAAFLAVIDAASEMGGHIVAIPRDNLPVLTRMNTSEPLWGPSEAWQPTTEYRTYPNARVAVLALGAPAFVAGEGAELAARQGTPADVTIVNGFPLPESFFEQLAARYDHVVTIEDGLIGTIASGLRGLAAFVASQFAGSGIRLDHLGVSDPRIAPSDDYRQVWEHYGMTAPAVATAIIGRR